MNTATTTSTSTNREERVPLWATDRARLATYEELLHGTDLEMRIWEYVFAHPVAPFASWAAVSALAPLEVMINATPLRFSAPPTLRTLASRPFEMQLSDGYLCALHALNNVAHRPLLTPVALIETEMAMRTDVRASNDLSRYAFGAELVVAALRRGVVLARMSVANNLENFAIASGPANCVESLLRRANGFVVLFPSASGRAGHFVAIVPLLNTWAAFGGQRLYAEHPDLVDTLNAVIATQHGQGTHQTREIVALVPLAASSAGGGAAADATLRAWRSCTLRNMSAGTITFTSPAGGSGGGAATQTAVDIQNVGGPPPSAMAINHACARITALTAMAATAPATRVPADVNVFTFCTAQYQVEDNLNVEVNELAELLLRLRDRLTDPLKTWTGERTTALRQSLQVVKAAFDRPAMLGLFFGPQALIDNATWLRYAAVALVARRLFALSDVRLTREPGMQRLCALLCCVAWTWHSDAGSSQQVNRKRFRAMSSLYVPSVVTSVLPAMANYAPFLRRTVGDVMAARAETLLVTQQRAKSLWLLHEALQLGVLTAADNLPLELLVASGDDLELIGALRSGAFAVRPDVARADRLAPTVARVGAEARTRATQQADTLGLAIETRERNRLIGDAEQNAKNRTRRVHYATDLASVLDTCRALAGAPCVALANLFAVSAVAYRDWTPQAIAQRAAVESDAQYDARMLATSQTAEAALDRAYHVLEQVYVVYGASALYGTTYDRPPATRVGVSAVALARNQTLQPRPLATTDQPQRAPETADDFIPAAGQPAADASFDTLLVQTAAAAVARSVAAQAQQQESSTSPAKRARTDTFGYRDD